MTHTRQQMVKLKAIQEKL